MSENFDAFEEADDETMGAHFRDLVEITDVSEEQLQDHEEEEQDINDREQHRRRLCEAETSCRQQRELRDEVFADGLALDKLINDMEAENKYLTSKVKELEQQLANIRKRSEEEDEEEALLQELLFEEERIVKNLSIYTRKMEKENQKLREKNANLTAKLDQLSLGEKYQEKIQHLRRAEQEFKHKLEEVQEILRSKDEEIEMKSRSLIQKNNKIEEYVNTIEDIRQDQQELREQLSNRQEEQTITALNFQEESTTRESRQPLGSPATDEEDEEHKDEKLLNTENWWCRAKGLLRGVKAAGVIIFIILLLVVIMTSMVLVYNSPDPYCNLWNITLYLLEPYTELHYTQPPVF